MSINSSILIPVVLLALDCSQKPQTEDRIAHSPDSIHPLQTTVVQSEPGVPAKPRHDDQSASTRRPKLIAHLNDGSQIVGIPTCDVISVQTAYGSLDLPFMDLLSIDFRPGNDSLRISFQNGDKLHGILASDFCQIVTIIGNVSLVPKDLLSVVIDIPATGNENSLLGYYPFNGNTNDTSGGGHHGVLYGAILTTDRFGHSNSAYMFDGVNDYVDVPNTNNWNFIGGFTLVAWVNFSQNIVDAVIVGKHNWGSYNGYALNVFNSRHCFYVSSDPRISAPQQSNDGHWHMVAGVYNGQTQYLYLDGVLVNNRVVAYTNTNTTNVRIGAANIAGYFAGKIDDVRMYSRSLSSSEIQGLYHEGGW